MSELVANNSEFEYLLASVINRYGVDLTGYSRNSLMRRVINFKRKVGIAHLAQLSHRLLHDRSLFAHFLNDISVSVTQFFRDPQVFLSLKKLVFPVLSALPCIKIWHAGCASGQEVFSIAILLHEAGLLERATIYATDISSNALTQARESIYTLSELQTSKMPYEKAGGEFNLKDYYTEKYDYVRFKTFLRKKIIFAEHDLVTQAPLAQVDLLLCRNVFIYFDRALQKIVTEKFSDVLSDESFLVLGNSESLQFVDDKQNFFSLCPGKQIYQRRSKKEFGCAQ